MSEQLARQIIDNYVASTLALRVSSSVRASEAESDIDAFRVAHANVFIRWQNAAASLQELPTEYMAQAVTAIDHITA